MYQPNYILGCTSGKEDIENMRVNLNNIKNRSKEQIGKSHLIKNNLEKLEKDQLKLME